MYTYVHFARTRSSARNCPVFVVRLKKSNNLCTPTEDFSRTSEGGRVLARADVKISRDSFWNEKENAAYVHERSGRLNECRLNARRDKSYVAKVFRFDPATRFKFFRHVTLFVEHVANQISNRGRDWSLKHNALVCVCVKTQNSLINNNILEIVRSVKIKIIRDYVSNFRNVSKKIKKNI